MKLPKRSPLKLFAPATLQFATAGGPSEDPRKANMMFASGGGGNGGGYDDDEYLDDDPDGYDQPAAPSRRGGGSAGSGGGRQRTVQFEPEERFWTEYLRIALPIIGLLLLIGVFWFWAQALIDDDGGETPESTQTPVAQVNPTAAPTEGTEPTAEPTAEADGGDENTPTSEDPTQTPAGGDEETPPPDEETPTDDGESTDDGASGDVEFAESDVAYVSDDGVNVRSEPSAAGEDTIVTTLNTDTEVTITGAPEEDEEGNLWYPVSYDGDEGVEQWIREDFLSPDPSE